MIAVSDTSPICYLVLTGDVDLLPKLYSRISVPRSVVGELRHPDAPLIVRQWAANLPSWLTVEADPAMSNIGMEKLQVGEQAAILLAESIAAATIVLDEKSARRVAIERGLRVTGHIGSAG